MPRTNAVVAIDLGEKKQVAVVCDHDSRVLGRRRVKGSAWMLGAVLDWAAEVASGHGFASVTVACEPTGHRWMTLGQLAAERGLRLVCVQPVAVHRAREGEDYTRDKSDDKDAVLIARLAVELRFYRPEQISEAWGRLRHLGARRAELVTDDAACRLQLRDILTCCWPAVLDACRQPWESTTFTAALNVVLTRCDGDPSRLRRLGRARFIDAVRRELPRWGGQKIRTRIAEGVFVACADTTGVAAQRPGGLKRCVLIMAEWLHIRNRRAEVDARMLAVLDDLDLADLAASIPGVTAVTVAAILAETGDLTRFDTARAVVKHAGLCPRDNDSGAYHGAARISRRGRPRLRTAAWRAAWGGIRHNRPLTAKYEQLTGRHVDRLTPGQAHVACAAALLRWLHAMITNRFTFDQLHVAQTHHDQHLLPAAA